MPSPDTARKGREQTSHAPRSRRRRSMMGKAMPWSKRAQSKPPMGPRSPAASTWTREQSWIIDRTSCVTN